MRIPFRSERGISMVEALVALVVLSVGMLGIAGLYVTSVKTNRSALLRTQAVNFVNDMADRIRANGSARGAYDLAGYGGAPVTHNCVAAVCTTEFLAEDDLQRWLAALTAPASGLPGTGVGGNVIYTAAASGGLPDQYTISVRWREAGDTADSTYATNLLLIAVPSP